MRRLSPALSHLAAVAALAASPIACHSSPPATTPASALAQLRASGPASSSADVVARWALAEMVAPGGTAAGASAARARLDSFPAGSQGTYASLARALYEDVHGHPKEAADAYVATLVSAQSATGDPDAPLVAWFASHHLLLLRGTVTGLFASHRPTLERLMAAPGELGWRAVAELVDWNSAEEASGAVPAAEELEAVTAKKLGCAAPLTLAGPFGRGVATDRRRSFGPERPGSWPPSWPAEAVRGTVPHVLKTEQHRCYGGSTEDVGEGVFYVQTFFQAPEQLDVILAVQGAVALWVDDALVLERDLRQWGVWQKFGARVRVVPGRHRVLARVMSDGTSVRLLTTDGRPSGVATDADDRRGYAATPPVILGDPNPIEAVVGVAAAGRASEVPWLTAFLAAYAAHIDGLNDVADVLMGPLVEPESAAPVALEGAARFVGGDAAYPGDVQQRMEKDLRSRAVAGDPRLWASRAWLIVDKARQAGLAEGVGPFRQLVGEFPAVPEILSREAELYGELGWRTERLHAVTELAQRFPEDPNALRQYVQELDEHGSLSAADVVAERLAKLDPDGEGLLDRALARHDWKVAVAELRRLAKRRPERKDIVVRIADVLSRAGDPTAAAEQLASALAKNPEDVSARLRIADGAYAQGDTGALRRALAEALQVGSKPTALRAAVDLVEGATDLEPYRMDGRAIIRDFEAWQRSGRHMDGSAARVLDYSALWVHPDAASEMLEHEILRVQSQEAIGELSEQPPPTGLVLHLRVIKPDGSVLEPEPVGGKHTLTLPHLEVGDYVEIEHVSEEGGDGEKGQRYRGPEWFFREPDKGYWRSEFVAVTPRARTLQVETRGDVPPPRERAIGDFIERRWSVDLSPPAPQEPDSPPLSEFLPSIRLGWGVSLDDTVSRLVDVASQETPLDPRVRQHAREVAASAPPGRVDEQVRLLYAAIVKDIADGNESDGRRVVTGKSGSRQAAFQYLLRELGIPVETALVRNRLATASLGPMTEVEAYDGILFRVETGPSDPGVPGGVRWLAVRDKFAPAWYVPAEYRGEPALRLVPGTPRETTPTTGGGDGVSFGGRAVLLPDGSAQVQLTQRFEGKAGISIRGVLDKVPGAQLHDFLESALVGRSLPGAKVRTYAVVNKEDPAAPLELRIEADVPALARQTGTGLALAPIFPINLNELAALPERQTPLLLKHAFHVEVHFEIVPPAGLHPQGTISPTDIHDGERTVAVHDSFKDGTLLLDRVVDIPAGRVQPGPEYARFLRFIHDGDGIVERQVSLRR